MEIVKKALKWTALSIIIFLYLFLMLRWCSSGDSKKAKEFIWTADSLAAYQSNPDSFEVFAQVPDVFITSDGKFSISNIRYVPSLQQFQATIRYNDSTLKTLVKDYQLSEKPNGESFVFTISDNNGTIYRDYVMRKDKKNVYNYRRLVFDKIDLTDVTDLYLDIYYVNDVNFENAPYGSMKLYSSSLELEEFSIKKEVPSDKKPTADVTAGIAYLVKEEKE